ncbi:MAG TPA: caspase family protein [Archangium sp.]|uniref:caspase family protein n=1 Tax=Archangium sp. TaxID=1872627 RepID=UPI002E377F85|nr:caspase family protein [Archangium sp.]HEX5754022.1 caspase family protein [Archangium sp.]
MNALLALTLVALTAAPPDTGSPDVKRLAVVVGANRAAPGRTPLRYAHRDARSVASVLVEAGQFSRDDVLVLEDPEPSRVLAALDSRLERLGKEGREGLLLFYYSGHSDDRALYPNGQPLELKALRARLEDERAAVRVGILDACQGGSWTRAKGLSPAAPFAVEVPLALSSEGSVLLASSTGQEASHETDELQGSFFTHHLVAGLRGAADEGDDGQVTVGEAFAYAQRLTIRDTSLRGEAVQHPSFDLRLRGRQDLPLTRLASASSTLEVRQELGPLQVIQLHTGLVVLEVPEGRRALRMALPVGPYLVRRRTPEGTFARELQVEAGKSVTVLEENLELVGAPGLAAKRYARPLAATLTTLPAGTHAVGLSMSVGYGEVAQDGSYPLPIAYAIPPSLSVGYGVGLTDRLQLSVAGLPSLAFSRPVKLFFGIPTPTLSFRLGEAGRTEWVPQVSGTVHPEFKTIQVVAGLRTRWWVSDSSSVHAMASVNHSFFTSGSDTVLLRLNPVPSVGAGYSVTLGEVVTLAVGVSAWAIFSEELVLQDGILHRGGLNVRVGLNLGGFHGTAFPLLSIHLNDVWSLTGNASLGLQPGAERSTSSQFSAGVLATF